MGHILGLQHVTDNFEDPDNQTAIMLSFSEGSTRNHSFGTFPLKNQPPESTEFPIGNQNAVDYLLGIIDGV